MLAPRLSGLYIHVVAFRLSSRRWASAKIPSSLTGRITSPPHLSAIHGSLPHKAFFGKDAAFKYDVPTVATTVLELTREGEAQSTSLK